jgi:hypothetical protein
MRCDLEDTWAGCLKKWFGGFFFLILWQSYETALEMHERVYRTCCTIEGQPSS